MTIRWQWQSILNVNLLSMSTHCQIDIMSTSCQSEPLFNVKQLSMSTTCQWQFDGIGNSLAMTINFKCQSIVNVNQLTFCQKPKIHLRVRCQSSISTSIFQSKFDVVTNISCCCTSSCHCQHSCCSVIYSCCAVWIDNGWGSFTHFQSEILIC